MRILLSFLALTMLLFSSLWAIIHPWASHRLSKALAKLALILGLTLLLGWWTTPAAGADINFLKEADQWVYQSQQVLLDTDRNAWEVRALKQMEEGNKNVYLRVTAQSTHPVDSLFESGPTAALDAVAPLVLTTSSGESLTATNVTRQQFVGALPEPSVGQYDVRSLLPQLRMAQTVQLHLPTREENRSITINVSSEALEEWLTVGACDYIMCTQKN
ncbi:MAG: DUF3122 domain-containing protein [Cyanobacteria bacterium J06649_4]